MGMAQCIIYVCGSMRVRVRISHMFTPEWAWWPACNHSLPEAQTRDPQSRLTN